jgi:ubiquinone/menaquinone biosynthesis C-methylase UbiE
MNIKLICIFFVLVSCAFAEEKVEVLKTPDYAAFSEEAAARFDAMGRRRPMVYACLADYLVDRFDLSQREGVGIDVGGGTGDLGVEIVKRTEKLYWINTDINSWCSRYFAQRLLEAKASHRASFVFGDAVALPFGRSRGQPSN